MLGDHTRIWIHCADEPENTIRIWTPPLHPLIPARKAKPPKCAAGAHVSCGLCRPSLSAFKHCRKHEHPPSPTRPPPFDNINRRAGECVRGCVRVCEYVRASTTGLISSTCVRSCVDYRAIIDAIDHHHHHPAAPPLNRSQIAHTYFQYLSPSTGFGVVLANKAVGPRFCSGSIFNWCSHRRRVLHPASGSAHVSAHSANGAHTHARDARIAKQKPTTARASV